MTEPCCQLGAFIVSSIQSGRDGSNMAIPMLANVIDPETQNFSNLMVMSCLTILPYIALLCIELHNIALHCMRMCIALTLNSFP